MFPKVSVLLRPKIRSDTLLSCLSPEWKDHVSPLYCRLKVELCALSLASWDKFVLHTLIFRVRIMYKSNDCSIGAKQNDT